MDGWFLTTLSSFVMTNDARASGVAKKGSWQQGQTIRFLASDGSGMLSEIAELRPNEFISPRRVGMVHQGVDTTSEAVRTWTLAMDRAASALLAPSRILWPGQLSMRSRLSNLLRTPAKRGSARTGSNSGQDRCQTANWTSRSSMASSQ